MQEGRDNPRLQLTFPSDSVILEPQGFHIRGLEQVASVEDDRIFQARLDDIEIRTLEGFPFRDDD